MEQKYTDEPHAQILLALLKAHGVRKIVASPGATNIPIVGSIQNDDFFEVYSAVDERSAAYIACGLAEESGEIVVLSCTGATASRNYMPGLTEAYYRKLPVIAVTSFNGNDYIGTLLPQNIDRTSIPNDVAKISVQLPVVKDEQDAWVCNLKCNNAILESTRNGGGPVHINLTTTYKGTFTTKSLPAERVIKRLTQSDDLPDFVNKKVAIFIGAHKKFTSEEQRAIDAFCDSHQAVVLCDHTSSYRGNYRVLCAKILSNANKFWDSIRPDVVFHIGEVSGNYPATRVLEAPTSEIWRISEDGEIRDRGKRLAFVYEGTELSFFTKLIKAKQKNKYIKIWQEVNKKLNDSIPSLPFSNLWIASVLANKIPKNSSVYFGILNSLRTWNYYELDETIYSSSNVGGFGIDGCLSTMIGASLINKNKLYFSVIGDLAFFYDVNVIANRHIGGNIRILLINNGCGVEFNISSHQGSQFGNQTNEYISAGGHFSSGEKGTSRVMSPKSRAANSLAQSWATSLGFTYLQATNKEEFLQAKDMFTSQDIGSPIIFECFTNDVDESQALSLMMALNETEVDLVKQKIKSKVKEVIPKKVTSFAKNLIKK